jgi:hypothetical protein
LLPSVTDQQVTANAESKEYIQLTFKDEDGPGPYSYTVIRQPTHGTLSGDNNDRFYVPQARFVGPDEFAWKVNDGRDDSPVATVELLVAAAKSTSSEPQNPKLSNANFPPPESRGGWRKLGHSDDIRSVAGMDPAKLSELKDWLLASDHRDFAAVVIKNGHIVLEVERGNSSRTDARRVAPVSKAICATILAIAAEESQYGRALR